MPEFPKTDTALVAAGYVFDGTGRCSGRDCRAEIEWWITPKNKRIPLNAGSLEPHWVDCPNAKDFR